MICQSANTALNSPALPRPKRQDSLERTSNNKLTLNLGSSNNITKRHTIAYSYENVFKDGSNCRNFFKDSGLHQEINQEQGNSKWLDQPATASNTSPKSYWETIEGYYTSRLNALEKEIETATQQNSKLSMAREELVQQVLKLHEQAMSLTARNDALSRSIAEKENRISAFMYNQTTLLTQQQQDNKNDTPVVGVTLVDQPLSSSTSPPTPPLPSTNPINLNDNIADTTPPPPDNAIKSTEAPVKKEPGIFRQISLRLSNRKKRRHQQQPQEEVQHQSSSLQISEPIKDSMISTTSSDSILHPAVVISSSEDCPNSNNKDHPLVDNTEDNTNNHKRKKNLVFGNDLIQQARSDNSVIPSVVMKCVREVETRGMSVEGIYRQSGALGQVKELQDAYDKNKNLRLSKYQDINVITSLLKLYFRELATPLIPSEFILPDSLSDQERFNKTYDLLHHMPIESYCTIKFLVQHLKRVHENQSVNRMPLRNLAVVFGPTLMRVNTAGNKLQQQTQETINTIEFIIQQSHMLFADYS